MIINFAYVLSPLSLNWFHYSSEMQSRPLFKKPQGDNILELHLFPTLKLGTIKAADGRKNNREMKCSSCLVY